MLIPSAFHREPTRRGAVTVWVLIGLVVIIGIMAIGLDGGRMLEKRRHVQAAADAAALAAGFQLFLSNLNPNIKNDAKTAALSLAAANGFNNDGSTSTVTVNIPPASGTFAGCSGFVEVIVQHNLTNSFGAIFTNNKLPVSARAVAVGRPLCIGLLLLGQIGPNALLNSSEGTVTVVGGRVLVNSSDSAAFAQIGTGTISAAIFDVTGNYSKSAGTIQGQIRTGVRRTADPLLSLPAPDVGAFDVQSSAPLTISSSMKTTLQPGVYKGGIRIGNSASVVMSPGIYILQGGGFQISEQAALTGHGVLIYNTGTTASAGSININTGGPVTLDASAAGTYRGISIFQDRAITQALSITGNGSTTISGFVYAPGAAITLTGNSPADTLGGGYIGNGLKIGGEGNIHIDPGSSPLQVTEITLVE